MQNSKNPLRKLSKLQLLELLAQQEKELQALRAKIEEQEAQLAERQITIETSGSIAEAALRINRVFEAAQSAADQYLESLKAKAFPEKSDEEILNSLHEESEA